MPSVSIIVPVYNTEKYLRACLESILCQTFQDFELIIVNDGTRDSSQDIIDEFAARDKRIVALYQENSGLSAARNHGMDVATGKYIWFVDSDDSLCTNTAIEEIYTECERNELDMCLFNAFTSNDQNDDIPKNLLDKNRYQRSGSKKVMTGEELFIEQFNKKSFIVCAVLYMVRRQFLIDHGLRFMDGVLYEDNCFTLSCLFNTGRVKQLEGSYYNIFRHSGSIMTSSVTMKNLISMAKIITTLCELIHNKNLSDDGLAAAMTLVSYRIQDFFSIYWSLMKNKDNSKIILAKMLKIQVMRLAFSVLRKTKIFLKK